MSAARAPFRRYGGPSNDRAAVYVTDVHLGEAAAGLDYQADPVLPVMAARIWTWVSTGGGGNTWQGMMAGTSPSITP